MEPRHLMRCSLVRNLAGLFGAQAALLIPPLFWIPYLVRVLGPESFGKVAFAQALVGYFLLFTDYGFNLSATRETAHKRSDPQGLARLFGAVTATKALIAAMGFAAMSVLVMSLPVFGNDLALYVCAYVAVLGNVLFPTWLYQGLESSRSMATRLWTAQIVVLGAIFVLVRHPADYRIAALLQGSGAALAGLLGATSLAPLLGHRLVRPSVAHMREVLAEGWHVFTSTAAVSLYSHTNTLVLGGICGPVIVGYFGAADKLIRAVLAALTPIAQAAYPRVATLTSQSQDLAYGFVRRLLRWQLLGTLAVSLLIGFLARPVVRVIFGESFEPAVSIVRWMAPLPLVIGLSNILGVQVMLNIGMKLQFSRILVASGIVNIALIVPLAAALGGVGAAVSTLATELLVTAAMALVLARRGVLMRLIARGA